MPPRRRAQPLSPDHAAFGLAVEELRLEGGLTQEQLAERMGTTFNRVGELERGATDSRLSTLLRVARALDLELVDVAGRFRQILEGRGRARGGEGPSQPGP
ncbi:MAG: helix-turn-helix transcriptional regulator [Actinobacteria bacterium]|nr:helix-turn-helix transcriptional regulator [Actinomycetota bacterium]